jgi:hypothetical protein
MKSNEKIIQGAAFVQEAVTLGVMVVGFGRLQAPHHSRAQHGRARNDAELAVQCLDQCKSPRMYRRRLYLLHLRTTQTSTVPTTTLQKLSPTTRPLRCAPTSTVRNPTRNTALLSCPRRTTTDKPSIREWIITPPAQPQRHAACHVSRHNLWLPGSSMGALCLPA